MGICKILLNFWWSRYACTVYLYGRYTCTASILVVNIYWKLFRRCIIISSAKCEKKILINKSISSCFLKFKLNNFFNNIIPLIYFFLSKNVIYQYILTHSFFENVIKFRQKIKFLSTIGFQTKIKNSLSTLQMQ